MAKNLLKILINTILGAILIFIWLKFVDIHEIIKTISGVSPLSLIPVFLCMLISPIFRALRLKVLLSPIQKIPFKDLVFLNGLAMMLSFFIPIRAGEIAKGIYLNNVYKLPVTKSIVWIFLDRFLDFLIVILLSTILLFIIPTTLPANFISILSFVFAGFLLATYLLVYQTNLSRKIANFLSSLLIVKSIKTHFVRLSNFFLDTFSILKRGPKDAFVLVAITCLAYIGDAFIWYFAFLSLNSAQDPLKMLLAQLLSALTYLVPAAPGYVGSAEASGALVFSGVFGIETNLASAMVVLFHVCTLIFILIYGILSVYMLKINLGDLVSKIFKKTSSKSS